MGRKESNQTNKRPDKMSDLIWIQTLFDTLIVMLKDFFEQINLEKKQSNKKVCKITQRAKC